jgi:pilus assembly protein CpaF
VFGKRSTSGSPAAVTAERLQPAPRPAPPPPDPAPVPAASPQGGRTPFPSAGLGAPILSAPSGNRNGGGPAGPPMQIPTAVDTRRSDTYYETKGTIFGALIEAIDLGQLAKLDADSARARKSAISSTRSSRSRTS